MENNTRLHYAQYLPRDQEVLSNPGFSELMPLPIPRNPEEIRLCFEFPEASDAIEILLAPPDSDDEE